MCAGLGLVALLLALALVAVLARKGLEPGRAVPPGLTAVPPAGGASAAETVRMQSQQIQQQYQQALDKALNQPRPEPAD